MLHALKTGRLIEAAVVCGAVLTGADDVAPYRAFAAEVGLLFQIVDDILDETGDEAELGKSVGKDRAQDKITYVSRFGMDGARRLAAEAAARAGERLAALPGDTRRPRRHHRLHPRPPALTCGRAAAGGARRPPAQARCYTRLTMSYLDRVSDPADLHAVHRARARRCSPDEIREAILACVSEVGGHLAASLGTVELTVALHSMLREPARQHRLGRRPPVLRAQAAHRPPRRFGTIRQYGGLSGFPNRAESEHDVIGTGHASTSISYGLGLVEAARLAGATARAPSSACSATAPSPAASPSRP